MKVVKAAIIDSNEKCTSPSLQTTPKPYQNRTKTVPKPYQSRIKTVPKPYQSRIKTVPKCTSPSLSVTISGSQTFSPYLQIVMDICYMTRMLHECYLTLWHFFFYSTLDLLLRNIWVKAFKNGPSKICGRQPLKNV